jgi:predicted alpha/beta hydrolase
MMGWETANMHLGTPARRKEILADLNRRKGTWLAKAAGSMSEAVTRDWRRWRKSTRPG